MNNSARTIITGSTGIAIIAFTAVSAAVAGFAAPATVIGVGAFVVWGLIEIAMVDYVPHAAGNLRLPVRPAPVRARRPIMPALVEFRSPRVVRQVA
jgi:hypothetical protein